MNNNGDNMGEPPSGDNMQTPPEMPNQNNGTTSNSNT